MHVRTNWVHFAVLSLSIFLTSLPLGARAEGSAKCSFIFHDERIELHKQPELRLMTYNLENFLFTGKDAEVAAKATKIASIVKEEAPDLMVLQEVVGMETLPNFTKDFLKSEYDVYQVPGNETTGIGFLVKSNLKLDVKIETHKERTWKDTTTNNVVELFTRDVPALIIKTPGRAKPFLIVLGNHAKSQRDRQGDPESKSLRTAQAREIAKIAREYKTKYGEETPIVIAGDFNTDVVKSAMPGGELTTLVENFKNSFELSSVPVKASERVTHTYHPKEGARELSEMDSVWIDKSLGNVVESVHVYRYKDERGQQKPLPETHEQREKNPSDHFPLVVDLFTKSLPR